MGLAEAIADVIDILRGRPAGGGDGSDAWEHITAIIAESDGISNSEVTRIEKAWRESDEPSRTR